MRNTASIFLLALGLALPGCFNNASTSPETASPDGANGEQGDAAANRARGSIVSKGVEGRKVAVRLKSSKPARGTKPEGEDTPTEPKPARAKRGNVELAGFSPTLGSPGSKVEIFGTGFADDLSANQVTVGGVAWTVAEVHPDRIVAVVPDGAKDGAVKVKAGKKSGSADAQFSVLADDGGFGKPGPAYNGLIGEVFMGSAELGAMPDFSTLGDPSALISVGPLDIPAGNFEQGFPAPDGRSSTNFAIRFSGSLNVVEEAEYELCINSDDGSRLYLEGTLVVDNDHANEARETCELVYLEAGEYALRVEYFQGTSPGVALQLSWAKDGGAKTSVPADALFRPANPAALLP